MAKLNLGKIRAKADEIKEREKKRKEGSGDSAFLNKIPAGMIEVRVLPPWSDAGELAKEVYTHFKLPPGQSTVVDLARTYPQLGLDNPIQEILEEFADDLDVSRMWAKATPKINVYIPDSDINRENKDLPQDAIGKVKILAPSVGTYNQIVKLISNPRIGDITDAEEGFFITIEKTVGAKWQDTSYNVELCPRMGPIHEDPDEQERILEKIWDLDKIFPAPDDAKIAEVHTVAKALRTHLEKQLRSIGGKKASEEPTSKSKRAPRKKAAASADGGDSSNFSEGEEEAPPPSKKKASTKTKTKSKGASKPDCFGDSEVYKISDEQDEIYNDCIWEVPCMQTQKKAGTFCHEE